MGEWIEIFHALAKSPDDIVSPFMGEWIEIQSYKKHCACRNRLTLHG